MFYQATAKARFGGMLGERLRVNMDNWLKPAPLANPGMSQLFLTGDLKPYKQLVPWYGEFPGKYITCAAVAYALNEDRELEKIVEDLIARLAASQDESGLLSPHPKSEWLTGGSQWPDSPGMIPLWELWGYYHLIYGLMSWYEITGSPAALKLARSSADAVADFFLKNPKKLPLAKANENLGLSHGFALLYQSFGCKQYREMADMLIARAEELRDYTEGAFEGKAFWQLPWPRWEALHALQGMGASGDERKAEAMLMLAESILKSDRHNTGAFSSGEGACGDPYDQGAIETCCTVAWMALMTDCLIKTGSSKWADELEMSLFNEVFAAQHPTGRWWTYNTPQNGVRKASAHGIVFQAVEGSPELNCCSVNGPRMLGMTGEWGVRTAQNEITVNYYGESRWETALACGTKVILTQRTAYPAQPRVTLYVSPAKRSKFTVRLRIPAWSENTFVQIGSESLPAVPGEYLVIEREWTGCEEISITFDFSLHAWRGKGAVEGLHALYRGRCCLRLTSASTGSILMFFPQSTPIRSNWHNPPKRGLNPCSL